MLDTMLISLDATIDRLCSSPHPDDANSMLYYDHMDDLLMEGGAAATSFSQGRQDCNHYPIMDDPYTIVL
ncbi:hypothetical protein H257_16300 [Aphanomyces astaci]|uniref:Uncharacterized protein n=2 Tax=Aphanomyces astaci TaxID=112090 RepID=W4FL95_APHAT|nr:hypothetical protein H257_16300 [Aphanomyces astaci]ETV67574.1 hypothetical protein H257_16300 [Aphanomyces astaci]|eukprot:XP_009842978.1 hypothetical protein H257_16300 [Aphanomyces astaci]